MRRCLVALGVAALFSCRSKSTEPLPDAKAANTPRQAIDEGTVRTMSHALLDSWDRANEEGFTRMIGAAFEQLDEQDLSSRGDLLDKLRARGERHAPPSTRTYGEEHVTISDNSAVFVGEAVEHYPSDGTGPAGDFDGWNTLVWVREGDGWKAAFWQWIKGGLDAQRAEWDSVYRDGRAFNPEPTKFLADMLKGRKPGAALDIMMGQGRNALYLASQGWHVTGIDISTEGLRQARAAADMRKLHIETINADADAWDYGVEKWDLVVMTYAGCCDARRVRTLRTSMRRGGMLVAEGVAGEKVELSALFKDGFTVVRDEIIMDLSDWGSAGGRDVAPRKLFRFAAEKR